MLSALALPSLCAAGTDLVIDGVVSNSPQRSIWIAIVDQFTAANPDVHVVHRFYPQEQYKREFTARLRSGGADLAFWYAGERLHDAAKAGLLAPLDPELEALLKKTKFSPGPLDGTRIDGAVYGFPLYYYVWGFVYRKSLFDRLGLRPPATWDEFLQVCARLKAAGVPPLGLGAKSGWPAAGWFDYLDLRLNGIDFHRKLLRGEVPFTDQKVRRVFDVWGDLLRKGYFLKATLEQDPDRVLPYLYRDQVGMTLMGSSVASRFPEAIAGDVGFFAFPRLSPAIPAYEEAPLDVLVLPARGANAGARERFLAFLAESGAVRRIAAANQSMPAQVDIGPSPAPLIDVMNAIINRAAGRTFFFDRDAKTELVAPVFDGLRQFLRPPHDTEQAVRSIERSIRQARAPKSRPAP